MEAARDNNKGGDTIVSLAAGIIKSHILFASCNLKIYDILEDGGAPMTSSSVASVMGIPEVNLHRLLRACAAMGLLEEKVDEDGNLTFSNTDESRLHLRHDDPFSFSHFLTWRSKSSAFALHDLEKVIREAEVQKGDNKLFARLQNDEPLLRTFNTAMASLSTRNLHCLHLFDLSAYKTVIDCGGGIGVMGRELKQTYSNMTVSVLDLPHVVEDAKKFWAERQEDPGVDFIAGDFLTESLPKADLYLLSLILHDWSDDYCYIILRNISNSLSSGQALLILDKVYREDVSNPADVCFDIMMMVVTGGKQRTLADMKILLTNTGFTDIEFKPGDAVVDAVFAIKK